MAEKKSRYKQLQDRWELGSEEQTDWYAGIRKSSQSALIYLSDYISQFNKRYYSKHTVDPPNSNATNNSPDVQTYDIESTSLLNDEWRTGYTMFAPITSQKEGIKRTSALRDPIVAFNQLTGRGSGLQNYFNFYITPAQQAALVPKIRVFKIEYKTTGTGATRKIKKPFELKSEREIVFSTYTKSSDLAQITAHTKAREDATGIKSFTWDLKGVNPAEVDANIEASLKIFFNNVDDIFRNNVTKRSTSPDRALASFVDLVLFSPPVGRTHTNPFPACTRDEGEGKYFEIRVDVGWEIPAKNMIASAQDSRAYDTTGGANRPDGVGAATVPHPKELFSHLEAAYIAQMRTSLYMQLTDHQFDFGDDGTATLTANYRARSTMVDERYNLLAHVKDQTEGQREMLDTARNPGGEAIEGSMDDETQEKVDDDAVKDEEENLKNAMNREYKKIVKELVLKHVYTVDLPLKMLLNFRGNDMDLSDTSLNTAGRNTKLAKGKVMSYEGLWQTLFSPQTQPGGLYNPRNGTYGGNRSGVYIYNDILMTLQNQYGSAIAGSEKLKIYGPGPLDNRNSALEGRDATFWDLTSPIQVPGSRGPGQAHQRVRHALTEDYADYVMDGDFAMSQLDSNLEGKDPDSNGAPQRMKTNFFFFGDILEVFMKQPSIVEAMRPAGSGGGGEKMSLGVVLLDILFLNPRKVLNEMDVAVGAGLVVDGLDYFEWKCSWATMKQSEAKNYLSTMNVANIPIVVELFLDFLKTKIISQQRTEYYLEDFITDIFNQFVKPVIMNHGMISQPPTGMQSLITSMTVDPSKTPFFKDKDRGYVNGPTSPESAHEIIDCLAPKDPAGAYDSTAAAAGTAPAFPPGNTGAFNKEYTIGTYAWNPGLQPRSSTLTNASGQPVKLPPFREPSHQLKDMRNVTIQSDADLPKTLAADVKFIGFYGMHYNQSGQYSKNAKQKINNFVGGLSAGCVKGISFSRVDQPHVREARTSKAKTFGRAQLRELYNVKIKLYGNTLVKPGQLIYVEATPMMFGFPNEKNSVANLLGMGGYYLVTEVSNELSIEGWTTTVTGLHSAWAERP